MVLAEHGGAETFVLIAACCHVGPFPKTPLSGLLRGMGMTSPEHATTDNLATSCHAVRPPDSAPMLPVPSRHPPEGQRKSLFPAVLRCSKYQPGDNERLRFSSVFTPSLVACQCLPHGESPQRWCARLGQMVLWTVCAMKAAPTTCTVNAFPANSARNLSHRALRANARNAGQRVTHMPCNLA